jgi:hypothetical protein
MKIALVIPMNSSDNGKSFYDYKFYSKFLLSRKYFCKRSTHPRSDDFFACVH